MKKYDIVIGIPSYCEDKTISKVVDVVDRGLTENFPDFRSIIVNADNNSSDMTKQNFLKTRIQNDKKYISTPNGIIGKGRNTQNVISFARSVETKCLLLFDADVTSITKDWVLKMAQPILEESYDYCLPSYQRKKYDANSTNILCYPTLLAIFNKHIRQPIGGDFCAWSQIYKFIRLKKMANIRRPLWY